MSDLWKTKRKRQDRFHWVPAIRIAVSEELKVPIQHLLSSVSRNRRCVFARAVAMYVTKRIHKSSNDRIAEVFNYANGSSVASAVNRIAVRVESGEDPELVALVRRIEKRLGNGRSRKRV